MVSKKSILCDQTLKDAIIDLYLNVKVRSNDEVFFISIFPRLKNLQNQLIIKKKYH